LGEVGRLRQDTDQGLPYPSRRRTSQPRVRRQKEWQREAPGLGNPSRFHSQARPCREGFDRGRISSSSTRGSALLGHFLLMLPQGETDMSFDLILPFLRPIEPLLLDEEISEIMGNPDSTWWFERDGALEQADVCFAADGLRTGLEVVA